MPTNPQTRTSLSTRTADPDTNLIGPTPWINDARDRLTLIGREIDAQPKSPLRSTLEEARSALSAAYVLVLQSADRHASSMRGYAWMVSRAQEEAEARVPEIGLGSPVERQ